MLACVEAGNMNHQTWRNPTGFVWGLSYRVMNTIGSVDTLLHLEERRKYARNKWKLELFRARTPRALQPL